MLGPILDLDIFNDYDEAKKEEGRKENENKYLLSLLDHVNRGKIKLSDAASIANMSVDEFKRASETLISH